MDFIRTVTNSNILTGIINIPKNLKNKQVEILILPVENDDSKKEFPAKNKKLRGIFKKYSNIKLIKHEKSAWTSAVEEKYESR